MLNFVVIVLADLVESYSYCWMLLISQCEGFRDDDWLLHFHPLDTRKRWWCCSLNESTPALWVDHFRFDLWLFSCKFTLRSKPTSRNNHRKAPYPRTQQHDYWPCCVLNPSQWLENDVYTHLCTLMTPLPSGFLGRTSQSDSLLSIVAHKEYHF